MFSGVHILIILFSRKPGLVGMLLNYLERGDEQGRKDGAQANTKKDTHHSHILPSKRNDEQNKEQVMMNESRHCAGVGSTSFVIFALVAETMPPILGIIGEAEDGRWMN